MSSSSRCFILSLSLLIAVSGCSGSRMRKAFRADREFFTLSELEEYDARRDDAGQQPKSWSEKLASLSKRSASEDDETTSKREGFLNFGRLLGRDDESIPPDPFVISDQDGDAEDSEDRTIVSVGASKELPDADAEPLVGDDWVTDMAASAAASDSRDSSDQSATGISFSDIMAEFADEGEENEDLDALADQLMAEHASRSGSLDDMVADFSDDSIEASDIDQFELSPDMFLDDTTEPEDDVPVLSMSDDADDPLGADPNPVPFEDTIPDFSDAADESSTFDFSEAAVEIAASSEQRTQTARDEPSATRRQKVADVFGNDVLESGSLWKNSSQATSWEPEPAPRRTSPEPQFSGHQQPEPAWNSASASHSSTSFSRTDRRQQREDSMSFASSPLLLPGSEPGLVSQSGTLAQVPASPPVTNNRSNDPFLNDFETLAETTPASAPSTTRSVDGVVAGFSPKMWVVLLGSVIILYLLFAPERQSAPEQSNR